ncbi:MAG: aldo/keto reductase [Dongiaceae bacterium]
MTTSPKASGTQKNAGHAGPAAISARSDIKLNDGRTIPQIGIGVWQVGDGEASAVVSEAILAGYRLIDTAAAYNNETGVGQAINANGVRRADLFVTTKLWNDRHDYDETLKAFDESLKRLQIDYLDLYLIHWPAPKRGAYVHSWKAFKKLRDDGRVKSIGVSNFTQVHLQRLFDETGTVPALNQIELHPQFQQKELRAFHAEHGIATESWSPLGQGKLLQNDAILDIAKKHMKTPAQIIIRWHLENGLVVIPKSSSSARIHENIEVFNFHLDADDLAAIANLDRKDGRIGPDPDVFS